MTVKFPIYLDSHATTPVDPRVFEAMKPYFTEKFGNASSLDHKMGHEASNAVAESRDIIAKSINAEADEIVFTSGATESDNLALRGVMARNSQKGDHMITCVTEHKAILDTARNMENNGIHVSYVPVDEYGIVDLQKLQDEITDNTVMVSIMTANNEIGTIADVAEIGKIAHEHGILFHTDAAQAVGHIPIDVQKMNIDLMSFSSHKIYGPKGIGALYVRGMMPRVKIDPMICGGEQEKNIRSGTLNIPGIIGFAKAVEITMKEMYLENERCRRWTYQILNSLSEAYLNGHPTKRLAHNLNMRFDGIDGKAIINTVSKKLAISAGSACTTQSVEPSHVLLSLGLTPEQAHSSIRIGCGRFNTQEEIQFAINEIASAIKILKTWQNEGRLT